MTRSIRAECSARSDARYPAGLNTGIDRLSSTASNATATGKPTASFAGSTPTTSLIELDEGPVMLSNVIGVDPAKLAVGLPVAVAFEAVDDSLSIPVFKPAG